LKPVHAPRGRCMSRGKWFDGLGAVRIHISAKVVTPYLQSQPVFRIHLYSLVRLLLAVLL
jgi:hypothetical protein